MKRIKATSKIGQRYLKAYGRAVCKSIEEFYSRPSEKKIWIEKQFMRDMIENGGEGYKILCGNVWYFTAAWMTSEGLRIEAGKSAYLIEIE